MQLVATLKFNKYDMDDEVAVGGDGVEVGGGE